MVDALQTILEPTMDGAVRVYFGVFDFGTAPGAISELLGLEPHQTWRRGDEGPRGGRRTHDRWELRGEKCESAPFEEQLDELLGILESRPDGVRAVVERFEAGICCVAKYRDSVNPSVHLSSDAIRRMARLGVSCDFDLYILDGTDTE